MAQIYETIYRRLERIGILAAIAESNRDYVKFTAPGFMDLHVDVLRRERDRVVISLRHSYVQNGDSMADPDMEVSIIPAMKMAEALAFQQDGVPGVGTIYQRVYPEPGKVYPKRKHELNAFLAQWLGNIIEQGHALESAEAPATNRPGDMAAIYAEEAGVDHATALVHCNMD